MDEFLKDLPKFIRLSDDMHDMANYINDMRIIVIVITLTSYIGVFIFIISKFYQNNKNKCKNAVNEDTEMQDVRNVVDRPNGFHQNRPDKGGFISDA
jgi:hypothetical protein